MKSRTSGGTVLKRGLIAAAVICVSACGQSGSATAAVGSSAPQPIAGDIERTTFAPVLGVNLGAMTKRASGMYVQDLAPGTGAVATRGRSVVVRYTGWLPNGKQFDTGEISVTLGSNNNSRVGGGSARHASWRKATPGGSTEPWLRCARRRRRHPAQFRSRLRHGSDVGVLTYESLMACGQEVGHIRCCCGWHSPRRASDNGATSFG